MKKSQLVKSKFLNLKPWISYSYFFIQSFRGFYCASDKSLELDLIRSLNWTNFNYPSKPFRISCYSVNFNCNILTCLTNIISEIHLKPILLLHGAPPSLVPRFHGTLLHLVPPSHGTLLLRVLRWHGTKLQVLHWPGTLRSHKPWVWDTLVPRFSSDELRILLSWRTDLLRVLRPWEVWTDRTEQR